MEWGEMAMQETSSAQVESVQVFDGDTLKTLEPKPEHASETFVIVNLLNRYHYRKVTLNDSLSFSDI